MSTRTLHLRIFFAASLAVTVAALNEGISPALGQTVPASAPASAPAGPRISNPEVRDRLAAARKELAERTPQIEAELNSLADQLRSVEEAIKDRPTPESTARRDDLTRRRSALQNELVQLQAIVSAWQSTADSVAECARLRKELEELKADQAAGTARIDPGEIGVIEAQLQQARSVQASQRDLEAGRRARLEVIEAELKKPDVRRRSTLELERRALQAQLQSDPIRRTTTEARIALFEARLAVARMTAEAVGSQPTSQPQTASAPSSAAETANKRRLAQELELEARDRLAYVQQQIVEIQQQIDEAEKNGEDVTKLENSRDYWRESEQYERRRVRQADLKKREARLRQDIDDLQKAIGDVEAMADEHRRNRYRMTQEQRKIRAEQLREDAESALADGTRLDGEAEQVLKWIEPNQQYLPVIDASQAALEQRLRSDLPLAEYQRLYSHYMRMKRVFDAERQQVDQMVTTQTVTYYQTLRLATLKRRLAAAYRAAADVLVPPEPSFFERNRKVLRALGIFGIMVAAGYLVKFLVWLTERVATWLEATVTAYQFSVKRISTLGSFAGSIAKLFIWIFGIITILYEFGIDPATSSGAIGLVGLIMAGMFQQIVVDFIKGLDIIAGRHYNVGDFIEVDSKYGHVIDFNVKYTRIRTLSGQEFNIPNSRCIPSRRFPEGYVDNYVDIVLKTGADVNEAKSAILPVCLYLNTRLEPIKERPQFIDRFRAVGGRAILRYRVRVLPGCDWVIRDYFVPAVKAALGARGIELDGEPTFFFINRIDTFRKLFSRQLSEQEILQEVAETEAPVPRRADKTRDEESAGPARDDKRPLPDDHGVSRDKPPAPVEETAVMP